MSPGTAGTTSSRRRVIAASLLGILALSCGAQPTAGHAGHGREAARPAAEAPEAPAGAAPGVSLTIRDRRLDVEVVREPEERALGLMFRASLAPDSGMLFVFDSLEHLGFWMKNTWIPLDIAFADDAGVIVDIQRMAPHDTTTGYHSARPARYAVEANLGWFAAAGARVGDTIHGIPR
ncbi:MAG: DUF192 domain-containing protein [bacterium]